MTLPRQNAGAGGTGSRYPSATSRPSRARVSLAPPAAATTTPARVDPLTRFTASRTRWAPRIPAGQEPDAGPEPGAQSLPGAHSPPTPWLPFGPAPPSMPGPPFGPVPPSMPGPPFGPVPAPPSSGADPPPGAGPPSTVEPPSR